jgi:hypothetical protein
MTKQLMTTLMYVAVAAVVLMIAWWAQSSPTVHPVVNDAGERFFAEFDPLDARALEIVRMDEEQARPVTFRVAQVNGVWSIRSHENYPADAADRLAQVATSVMDVSKGTVVSDNRADHVLFGVSDPEAEAVDPAGAGTRITVEGGDGKPLVDLIVGKAMKDAPGVHYLRAPGRDRVYTAAINISSVTTRFEDWIEPDLLQINPAEIREIVIDDYSIDEINRQMVQGELVELTHEAKTQAWSLKGLQDGEAIDEDRVRELTTALDDLRIVDVRRKPAGLSEQLAGDEGLTLDPEAVSSLASRGFYVSGNQLLANEGQTIVRMQDGVEYVLRFGEIALYAEGQSDANDDNSASVERESDDAAETNPGRYVFVGVGFNANAVARPELQPVPDVPASNEDAMGEMDPPVPGDDAAEQARQAVQQERDRIIALNETSQKTYDARLERGRERAKELAARFAPWYYVVPDSVYQKIRLQRADLVAPPDAGDDGAAVDDMSIPPMIERMPEQ